MHRYFFVCLLVLGSIAPTSLAKEKKKSPKGGFSDFANNVKANLENLKLIRLKIQKSDLDFKIEALQVAQKQLELLLKMPKFIAGEETKKEAKMLLEGLEESMVGLYLPNSFTKEKLPLIICQIQKQPLPTKLSRAQKSLLSSSKGDIEKMISEVSSSLNDERLIWLGLRYAVDGDIAIIEREIEKLDPNK